MDRLSDPSHYAPDPAWLAGIRERMDEYDPERPSIMQTAMDAAITTTA
jgi:hypothetical protein